MITDPRDYVAPDGEYIIPVSWEVYATVQITGVHNLAEAYEVAQEYIDDLPLATDPEYIDASYKIEVANDDELLDAQDYYKHDAYFKNPNAD